MAVRFDTRCDGVAALLRWCRFCAIGNGADDVGGRNAHHAAGSFRSGSRDVGVGLFHNMAGKVHVGWLLP